MAPNTLAPSPDRPRFSLVVAATSAVALCGSVALAQQSSDQPDVAAGEVQTAGADSADPTEDFGDTLRGRKDEPAAPDELAPVEASALHFNISVDYVTAYFSRGFRYEDRGFIIQPAGELGVDLFENDSCSIGAFVGIWNSFHDRATDAAQNEDFTDKWYEADLYAGVGGSIGNFGYSVTYLAYTSPSDAWETIDEVLFDFEYDDTAWWGESGFTLTPSLSFAWEVGTNFTDGVDRGLYLQPGITPAFGVDEVPLVEHIDFSFPVTVGLSLDDYYQDAAGEDEFFGFVSISAKAAIPLPVPAAYGNWTLSGGVQLLILGDTTSALNNDDETELIGTVGLAIEF